LYSLFTLDADVTSAMMTSEFYCWRLVTILSIDWLPLRFSIVGIVN